MRYKLRSVLALFMTVVILADSTDITTYAMREGAEPQGTETDANGLPEDGTDDGGDWDGTTMESVYEGEDYRVTFTLGGSWDGGYSASLKIDNLGDTAIENWYLSFASDNAISSIWNAEICSGEDGKYVIRNAGWNADIAAGSSIQFGFAGDQSFTGFPGEYALLGENSVVDTKGYTVEYCTESDWGSGFTGVISIVNNGSETIEDWVLEFDFAKEIDSIWCAEILAAENGHYTLKNKGYNADIKAGQTVSFGFIGKEGARGDEPFNYRLYSYKIYAENSAESGTDTDTDTDGDGLTDEQEIAWGLDYQNIDTDGDGLTDYEEIFTTLTNPLLIDTDSNGINDADEDMDGDGIGNKDELIYCTDPASSDTDGDNLTDFDELFLYFTDPTVKDTDGDGLTDGDELLLGFDPLLVDTDGNGITDAHEKLEQTVEKCFDDDSGRGITDVNVTLTVEGNAQRKINIVNMYGMDALSSNVVGLVGVPVEIHADVQFDTAELVFHYDETMLGEVKEENLSILWYDEANDWYRILAEDCVVDTDRNTVSYRTTHFSTYMLVDSEAWYDAWRENIDYRNSAEGDRIHNFDITFVVDVSGSMDGGRIFHAKNAMMNFVDAMQTGDEAAIVKFDSLAVTVCDYTGDKSELKKKIKNIYTGGPTDVNAGLLEALELSKDRNNNHQKIMVLICDGDVNYVQSTIDECIQRNIQIYAVNVVSATHYYLEQMAKQTGGQSYYAKNMQDMDTIMGQIQDTALNQIDSTDTDGDGLYDIFETAGIQLPNGQIVYTDPNKADTDGDGLSDFQETGIPYQLDERYNDGRLVDKRITYFVLKSDPTKLDTDRDGIWDNKDPHPWKMEHEWIAKLSNRFDGVEYLNIERLDGTVMLGGDQEWWGDKASYPVTKNLGYEAYMTDPYYRLAKKGCGTIAMSDMELYLTQQNPEHTADLAPMYDHKTGAIRENIYRLYVENNYGYRYWVNNYMFAYRLGLTPPQMMLGINAYLEQSKSKYRSALWAPYILQGKEMQQQSILNEIKAMLNKDLPVVFSYYSKDEDNEITMYETLELAKEKNTDSTTEGINGHYMTIIGLYKYMDAATSAEEYIMQVVSWGKIYYIRYDEYRDNIGYCTNILRIQ